MPDVLARRIIANTIAPAFKQGQYYAGLDQATDQLIALAKGEYKADPADARRPGRDGSGSGIPFGLIIFGLIVVFILINRGGGGRGGRRSSGLGGFGTGFLLGGGGGFGGGGFGGGGGGGFSGFGGGSSGGGGASGDW